MKSTLPVVLALLLALSTVFIMRGLSMVIARSWFASAAIPEFPLAITAAVMLPLVVVGAVVVSKSIIAVREIKTENAISATETSNNAPISDQTPLWFCRYCGTQTVLSSYYCDKCGNRLT